MTQFPLRIHGCFTQILDGFIIVQFLGFTTQSSACFMSIHDTLRLRHNFPKVEISVSEINTLPVDEHRNTS
jgi:hypothetical protein